MRKILLAGVLMASLCSAANAATIFGINEVDELVSFNSAAPQTYLSRTSISGLTDTLKSIDFRLADGGLYGLTADRFLVKIDTRTGQATTIGGQLALEGTEFGFDFNQSIDRLRIVSNTNQNYVVNPNTGTIQLVATNVAYPNSTVDADVTGSAYTPSVLNGPTTLYGIDSRNDRLVTQANNTGVLTTVGSLGTNVNVGSRVSFDIGRDGLGFVQDAARFYSVNLTTGMLTLVGRTEESLYGITVADGIAAVPEPTTWAMMIGGVGMVGGSLRRSRRNGRALATA